MTGATARLLGLALWALSLVPARHVRALEQSNEVWGQLIENTTEDSLPDILTCFHGIGMMLLLSCFSILKACLALSLLCCN